MLDVQDGKALLISKYGLDAKPYNTELDLVTWETCTLRTWLNDDFLKTCFDSKAQDAILMTNVDNSNSQCYSGWNTTGGNNTQDKVFLLSYAEVNKYFGVTGQNEDNTKARVLPTAYAIKNGAYTSSSDTVDSSVYGTTGAAGEWWLRSPGGLPGTADIVYPDGSLYCNSVDIGSTVVRPAFWVNLNSIL